MMHKNYIYLLSIGLLLIACLTDCAVFAESMSIKLADKVDMEFVLIASGSFISLPREYEKPSEPKSLASFYLGKYEVTQAQWLAVMGSWPVELYYKGEGATRIDISSILIKERGADVTIKEVGLGDNYPVYWVSFFDAANFCNALSIAQGLKPCYKIEEYDILWNEDSDGYRLPTEDEWEYAATCGSSTTEYYRDDEIDEAYMKHLNDDTLLNPTLFIPVGQKLPNAWKLYDMVGNVEEWCWYRLPPPYITEEDVERWRNDPMESWRIREEPIEPSHSVRGLSGLYCGTRCSALARRWDFGFRVARTVDPDTVCSAGRASKISGVRLH